MAEKEIKSAGPQFELFPEKWDMESIIGEWRDFFNIFINESVYQNMSSSTTGSSLSCSFSQFHFSMISTSTPGLCFGQLPKTELILLFQEQDCVCPGQCPHQAHGEGGQHPEASQRVPD